jgi:glycine dehydrogenase subunit 2
MNAMDNIATHRKQQMRRYHQARWDEPVILN